VGTLDARGVDGIYADMIRKLKSGEYRLYSRKKDASTGKRRNLGTFSSLEKAKQHEREVQYFKKRGRDEETRSGDLASAVAAFGTCAERCGPKTGFAYRG
jgi:hypothetical protein